MGKFLAQRQQGCCLGNTGDDGNLVVPVLARRVIVKGRYFHSSLPVSRLKVLPDVVTVQFTAPVDGARRPVAV